MEVCGPPPRPLDRYAGGGALDVCVTVSSSPMRGFLAASHVYAALVLASNSCSNSRPSGATQADILTQYPQLTAEGLAAAFRFAAAVLEGEYMWERTITA